MNRAKKILAVFMTVCMLISSIPFVASAATDPYEQSLLDQGWPAEYASQLTKLHYAHPNWVFQMDDITGMKSQYTWSYIQTQEQKEKVNLFSKSYGTAQPAYVVGSATYDTGWFQASDATIAFFMDPANFLNEYDVFMFENLRWADHFTVDMVETVLKGSFMYKTVIPDPGNTVTYAEQFYKMGKELGVSPVHLASRIKQEQGTGTSPLISGTGGTTLYSWYVNGTNSAPSSGYSKASLEAYNGYYNYFNMGASGTGKFTVTLNGLNEAKTGGWTTRVAALNGGAKKLKEKYIDLYQYTTYYQKFNIHPGAGKRNFWGQYMQNISAPLTECRRVQKAYAEGDLLDLPIVFTIPVMAGKPASNPNPGTYFVNTQSYIATMDVPSGGSKTNEPVFTSCSVDLETTSSIDVSGWSVHSDGVAKYEYAFDGGEYKPLNGSYRSDVANATTSYTNCTTLNAFSGSIPVSELSNGQHQLSIRGKCKNNNYYVISIISVNVKGPKYESVFDSPSGVTDPYGVVSANASVNMNDDRTEATTLYVKGWSVHDNGTSAYRYSINGGEFRDMKATYRTDVASAKAEYTNCTEINAFEDNIDISDCIDGDNTIKFIGVTKKGATYPIATLKLTVKSPSYHCELDSPDGPGSANEYITYTDTVEITSETQTYKVSGWSAHSNGLTDFVYSIDKGAYKALASSYRTDVANVLPQYTDCKVNGFNDSVHIGSLATGTHTLTISGKTNSANYYKVAVITLKVTSKVVNTTEPPAIGDLDSENGVLTGILPSTTAEELIAAATNAIITDANGNELTEGKLGSGYMLKEYDNFGNLIREITVIVNGDVTGDAMINSKDIIIAKLMISGVIEKGYIRAADLNNDGIVTDDEYAALAKHVSDQ